VQRGGEEENNEIRDGVDDVFHGGRGRMRKY
jgi:hypothetical protein